MGCWDSLCLLCGVAPGGGPESLAAKYCLHDDLQPIVAELRQLGVMKQLDDEELIRILEEGFDAGIANDTILPRGYGLGDYCQNYIGIGYWDDHGEFGFRRRYDASGARLDQYLVPDGRDVSVRRLRGGGSYGGKFDYVLERGMSGQIEETSRLTLCDPAGSPCLFLCEHCYHFLAAWLDFDSLPNRSVAFPNDPTPLDFPGELYEVVNSRRNQRGTFCMFLTIPIVLTSSRIFWHPIRD